MMNMIIMFIMKIDDSIRRQISRFLNDRSMSQKALAEQVGVTPLTVSRWLSGEVDSVQTVNWMRLEELLEPHAAGARGFRVLSPGWHRADVTQVELALLNGEQLRISITAVTTKGSTTTCDIEVTRDNAAQIRTKLRQLGVPDGDVAHCDKLKGQTVEVQMECRLSATSRGTRREFHCTDIRALSKKELTPDAAASFWADNFE
jgi:DNA-binding Xre family transcriptional regulator